MSETPQKRKQAPRRSPEAIAADYEARAARIKWRGVREGVILLQHARALIEEAQAAVAETIVADFGAIQRPLSDAIDRIEEQVPPEAR